VIPAPDGVPASNPPISPIVRTGDVHADDVALLDPRVGHSLAPDVVQYVQHTKDSAHELAITDRQIEGDPVLHDQRLEEITLEADGAAV
jgi:hypothetical protein